MCHFNVEKRWKIEIYIFIVLQQFKTQMLNIGAIARVDSMDSWHFVCYNTRATISNYELETVSFS